MKTAIRAIETEYAGCRFRSRLEARWAVFFDNLDMRWQYEPEGFELSDGTRYLPDFYLPGSQVWVEVKGGDDALEEDLGRVREFAVAREQNVLILGDVPAPAGWSVPVHSMIMSVGRAFDVLAILAQSGEAWAFIPLWAQMGVTSTQQRYVNGLFGADAARDAYAAARGARFEHGERG